MTGGIVLAMGNDQARAFFGPDVRARIQEIAPLTPGVLTEFDSPGARAALESAEVMLTCWEAPRVTADVLDAAPSLRAIIHSAGTVKGLVGPAVWERGIRVSSAADANAVPVAEYTLAQILLAGKRVLESSHNYATRGGAALRPDLAAPAPDADPRSVPYGNYGQRVGIVGASRVGRLVIGLLQHFDMEVGCYDPITADTEIEAIGARPMALNDLLAWADVVSVHAPLLESTVDLIGARELALMRRDALLVNTARAPIVNQQALEAELTSGRLRAVLDVTDPEPLPENSPLWRLPNVTVTPHIAGAQGTDVRRLVESAIEEVRRYYAGEPFAHEVTEQVERMSA